jgi:hypothetical protein
VTVPAFSVEVHDIPDEGFDFLVSGKTRKGKRWEETFTALPAMPIGALVDLGNGVMPASDCALFVATLLTPESAKRFEVLIRDKDRILTELALADITSRLFSAMAGRPTVPPVDLQGGSNATGTTSMDGSSSMASTSVGSMAPAS